MTAPLFITEEARPYLELQRGALWDLRANRAAWAAAYHRQLAEDFRDVQLVAPFPCRRVLDVGGGMAGIQAWINEAYMDAGGVEVCLLDGLADPPVMDKHRRTFNHAGVAEAFLKANLVDRFVALDPAAPANPGPCDLVVSLQAWCFHFEPAAYLEFVRSCCRPGAILVLDLRVDRPDWQDQLEAVFEPTTRLRSGLKFDRWAYVAR